MNSRKITYSFGVAVLVPILTLGVLALPSSGSGSGTCADMKASAPQGCWSEPSGYTSAPKVKVTIAQPANLSASQAPSNLGVISNLNPPPFPAAEYLTNNSWMGNVNGATVTAFAGNIGGDSNQGVVVIVSAANNISGSPTASAFESPSADGTLTISSLSGSVLTLNSSSGQTLHFDLSNDAYIAD